MLSFTLEQTLGLQSCYARVIPAETIIQPRIAFIIDILILSSAATYRRAK